MEFVDIAGLQGGNQGAGLGNQFLGNIREIDAIVHVVRCFENQDIRHNYGPIDLVRDIEIINMELILADLDTLEKRIAKTDKIAKAGDKDARKAMAVYPRFTDALNRGIPARNVPVQDNEREILDEAHLLTSKKVLYVANVSEKVLKEDGPYIAKVREMAAKEGSGVVVICGDLEMEIAKLDRVERREFLEDLGLKESGLQQLIREGCALLDLITFYTTVGPELRAWTIRKGTKAPQAAGRSTPTWSGDSSGPRCCTMKTSPVRGVLRRQREKGLLHFQGKDYEISMATSSISGSMCDFRTLN